VAAFKFRSKKKGVEQQLEKDIRAAQVCNTVLRTQYDDLLSEVRGLRELVSVCDAQCDAFLYHPKSFWS